MALTFEKVVSWDTAKILQTCCFGKFRHLWTCPPRLMLSSCKIVWFLSVYKTINLIPPFFSEILQRYDKHAILGTLGWLWSVKTTLPAFRKLWCLPSCKKNHICPSHISWNITKIL